MFVSACVPLSLHRIWRAWKTSWEESNPTNGVQKSGQEQLPRPKWQSPHIHSRFLPYLCKKRALVANNCTGKVAQVNKNYKQVWKHIPTQAVFRKSSSTNNDTEGPSKITHCTFLTHFGGWPKCAHFCSSGRLSRLTCFYAWCCYSEYILTDIF